MPQRTSTVKRFRLDIDGAAVTALKQFSGLGVEADIAQSDGDSDSQPKKNVANVRWTPGRATAGIAMGKGLYGWLKAALGGGGNIGGSARNGVFKVADFDNKMKSGRTFSDALITEFTVPKLDGASKETGFFDVAFEAEHVSWEEGNGEDIGGKINPKTAVWLCTNFKVTIGDLPCARVASVDAFTWRRARASGAGIGDAHEVGTRPAASASVPDITLSISSADYAAWADAAKKWFFKGASLEANEMKGRISLLSPTLKDADELGSIDLVNVGFKSFAHEDATFNSEQIPRFTVVLYVEKMMLNIKALDG